MAEPNSSLAPFQCLRCGNRFLLPFTPDQVEERTCPACGSNSVRRVKEKPAEKK